MLLLLVKDRTEVLDSMLIPLQLASGQLGNVLAAGLLSQCTVELLAVEEEQEKLVQVLLGWLLEQLCRFVLDSFIDLFHFAQNSNFDRLHYLRLISPIFTEFLSLAQQRLYILDQ